MANGFNEWLQSQLDNGTYYRASNGTIYRNYKSQSGSGWDPVHAFGGYSTDELIQQYQHNQAQQEYLKNDGQAAPAKDPIDDQIQAFYSKMMELRPDDPEVQQAMQFAGSQASSEAKLRGIDGSIAVSEVARQGGQALNQLRQFRQGLAAQALGLRNQRSLGLAQLGEQARQFDYGASQNAYGNRIGAGQAIGGAIGGVAGAFLGPVGAAAGAGIGAGIGGYVAGGGGGGYPQPPSYGSYGGYGGGNRGGGSSYGKGY